MAQVDIDRLINAFPPGNYSAGGWSIRVDEIRRTVTPSGTHGLFARFHAEKGAKVLDYTAPNFFEWTEAKSGTTTNEARALFAAMLDGL